MLVWLPTAFFSFQHASYISIMHASEIRLYSLTSGTPPSSSLNANAGPSASSTSNAAPLNTREIRITAKGAALTVQELASPVILKGIATAALTLVGMMTLQISANGATIKMAKQ
ncbi:unnamed protein product [Brassica oleracea var. botrytis]